MVDFIKCWLKHIDVNELFKNVYLDFKADFTYNTGEIDGKKVAVYKNLKFIINKGRATLQGSLHKYKNNGEHNFDDFTLVDLLQVLQDLKVKFGIDLSNCVLENLEIGVNVISEIMCYLILNNLMYHHGIIFKDPNIKNSNYKIAEHQRYSVKIYDKSLQYRRKYNIQSEILRIEIHFNKMADLNKVGIHTLEHIIKEKNANLFLELIIDEWEKTLLFDYSIDTTALKQNIKSKKINQWNNHRFWEGLTKQERSRQKELYNKIMEGHSSKTHHKIKNLMINKWGQLTKMVTN